MVTFELTVDGSWAQIYQERAQTSLEQATVAASTNSDHNALQLLSTQLQTWRSGKVLSLRDARITTGPGPSLRTACRMTPC
jgi:hypothetical protein